MKGAGRVFEFAGSAYVRSGELRLPRRGDVYLPPGDEEPVLCVEDHGRDDEPKEILTPLAERTT